MLELILNESLSSLSNCQIRRHGSHGGPNYQHISRPRIDRFVQATIFLTVSWLSLTSSHNRDNTALFVGSCNFFSFDKHLWITTVISSCNLSHFLWDLIKTGKEGSWKSYLTLEDQSMESANYCNHQKNFQKCTQTYIFFAILIANS